MILGEMSLKVQIFSENISSYNYPFFFFVGKNPQLAYMAPRICECLKVFYGGYATSL